MQNSTLSRPIQFLKATMIVSIFVVGWNILFLLVQYMMMSSLMSVLVLGLYVLYPLALIALVIAFKKGFAILKSKPALSPKNHALSLVGAFSLAFIVNAIIDRIYFEFFDPSKGYGEEVELGIASPLLIVAFYAIPLVIIYFVAFSKASREYQS